MMVLYFRLFKKYQLMDLLIAPITFWLIVNALFLAYLPGASFFIIPVFLALILLAILIFFEFTDNYRLLVSLVLSIPLIYMTAPSIEGFPVALGLVAMMSGIFFLVLLFGLSLPILHGLAGKKVLTIAIGVLTVVFFILATVNSGFDADKKKPNNITYYHNADNNVSYWASYNHKLDEFLSQFLGEDPDKGGLPEEVGLQNTSVRYYKKTENKDIGISEVVINYDSLNEDQRHIGITITPARTIHRYLLRANNDLAYNAMVLNGTPVQAADFDGDKLTRWKDNIIMSYYMSNVDSLLNIQFSVDPEVDPTFYVQSISYDLMENEQFDIEPRSESMMPFAFSIGDAIVVKQTVFLKEDR